MRWNASFFALMLPLAGCGGGWGYQDGAPATELPPAPQQSNPYQAPYGAQPGYEAPRDTYERPAVGYDQPGASYPAPGAGYSAPAPAQNYPAPAPAPAQRYTPQVGDWRDPAAAANGPAGTSQRGAEEERYDEVGYAGVRGVQGGGADGAVVAVHRSLPAGTIVEVTSLDTGRTILVLVTGSMGPGADHVIDLSPGAVRQLGGGGSLMPVRVRKVAAAAPDEAALRAGQPAGPRADAPPALLTGLRNHLPAAPTGAPVYAQPAYGQPAPAQPGYSRPATPAAQPARSGHFIVQLAALSNNAKAQGIARSMGGFVQPGGGLYRIRLGPFATRAEAEAARAQAARAGYGDARVFTQ